MPPFISTVAAGLPTDISPGSLEGTHDESSSDYEARKRRTDRDGRSVISDSVERSQSDCAATHLISFLNVYSLLSNNLSLCRSPPLADALLTDVGWSAVNGDVAKASGSDLPTARHSESPASGFPQHGQCATRSLCRRTPRGGGPASVIPSWNS